MASQSTNPYVNFATGLLEEAKILMNGDGWQQVATSAQNTKLEQKNLPNICSFPCYLVSSTIKKPKEELVKKIWEADLERAKKNDPKLKMMAEVETGPNWKVRSQYNGMGPLIWDRHTVFAQVRTDVGNVTYLTGFSVDHPKAPTNTTTHVRTNMHMSIYEFTAVGPKETNIRRIAQIDPKGDIPTWVVKMFANNNMNMFDMWKNE